MPKFARTLLVVLAGAFALAACGSSAATGPSGGGGTSVSGTVTSTQDPDNQTSKSIGNEGGVGNPDVNGTVGTGISAPAVSGQAGG